MGDKKSSVKGVSPHLSPHLIRENRVALLLLAGLLCFTGAVLGLGYTLGNNDRLRRERDHRARIEAAGARIASDAHGRQQYLQRFLSEWDGHFVEMENLDISATNEMEHLRQQWGNSSNERVRRAVAECESELAKYETRLAAAREAKARVEAAVKSFAADLDEIEGVAITNEATLKQASNRLFDCESSFSALCKSDDIDAIRKCCTEGRARLRNFAHGAKSRIEQSLHAGEPIICHLPSRPPEIDVENGIVRERIASVMRSGGMKMLYWDVMKTELREAEEEIAKKDESKALLHEAIFWVDLMESVHKLFVANAKGFRFQRGKLKGCEVTSTDKYRLRLLAPGKKNEDCIPWHVLYGRNRANLNELVLGLIERARSTGKTADGVGFDDESWAYAMLGAALTFQYACADDRSAEVRAEQMAKAAVRKWPSIRANAERAFPSVSFELAPAD